MAFATSQTVSLDELLALLDDLREQAAKIDYRAGMKGVALLLESSTKRNFDRAESPDGQPWAPLKRPRPRTKSMGKANASKGEKDRPLRDTGILAASMTAMGSGHVEDYTTNSLEWGTNIPYAHPHQHGCIIRRPGRSRQKPWAFPDGQGGTVFTRKIKAHTITIPARPFLGINEELADDIKALLADETIRQLGRA